MANICSNNLTIWNNEKPQQVHLFLQLYHKWKTLGETNDEPSRFPLIPEAVYVPIFYAYSQTYEEWLLNPETEISEVYMDFDSAWRPYLKGLHLISKTLELNFTLAYEDLSSNQYGEYHYDYKTDGFIQKFINPQTLDESEYTSEEVAELFEEGLNVETHHINDITYNYDYQ